MGDVISEGCVIPQFEVALTKYQKTNRYLLSDESDPQLQTALDRINSTIAARKEAQAEEDGGEDVSPTDSTTTTVKSDEKTTSGEKTSNTTATKKK